MKIFICEDEKEIAEIMKTILEGHNHQVKLNLADRRILKSIENFNPGLIILDYHLPDINGEELARKLKNNKKTRHIPIIIISASSHLEELSHNSKAEDFLTKPFNIDDLLATVAKYDNQ